MFWNISITIHCTISFMTIKDDVALSGICFVNDKKRHALIVFSAQNYRKKSLTKCALGISFCKFSILVDLFRFSATIHGSCHWLLEK